MKFLNNSKPTIVGMLSADNEQDTVFEIVNSLYDGAEAFGFQLDHIKGEYKSEECLKRMFSACLDKPIYVTSYKGGENSELTYDECAELLMLSLRCGATLLDVPGDYYDKQLDGMSFDPEAVRRQTELIDKIHSEGGEVLMSCHHSREFVRDEIISHALAQQARGADIAKIVVKCESEEKMFEHIGTIKALRDALNIPFLFLTSGPRKYAGLIRQIGPSLGVAMYLAVQNHGKGSTPLQPKLRCARLVRDNILL